MFTQKLAAHILTHRDTSAAGKSISGPAIAKHYAAIIDSREHGHEWVALALVACNVPARKSTRLDPVAALRAE